MSLTTADLRQISDLMDGAGVWQELKRRMDADGLTERIGPDGVQMVLSHWHRTEARRLADGLLTAELRFWANGGHYAIHVRGFNAVRPQALIDEARRRRWFVREMARGGWVVNPPEGQPLFLPVPTDQAQGDRPPEPAG